MVIRNLKYVYFYLQYMAVLQYMYRYFALQQMWLERTYLTTLYSFPGILCWFPVNHTDTVTYFFLSIVNFLAVFPLRAAYHADFTQHTYTFCTWNFSFFLFFTCTHPKINMYTSYSKIECCTKISYFSCIQLSFTMFFFKNVIF